MAVRRYKLGPGTLELGAVPFDASTQLKACSIQWSENVDSTDAVPMLSGDELPADENATYSAKLVGTAQQDLEAAGFVAWTWEHMGEEVAFTFQPRSDTARAVTGTVRVAPLDLGGDVKAQPDSAISWSCVGELPVFDDVAP